MRVHVGPTGAIPKAEIIGWIATGRLAHDTILAKLNVHGRTEAAAVAHSLGLAYDISTTPEVASGA